MSVVVLAINQQKVLVGQTSRFLMETPFELMRDDQRVYFNKASSEDDAFNILLGRIPALETKIVGKLGKTPALAAATPPPPPPSTTHRVKISRESIERKSGYFTGRYYSTVDLFPAGFVKGGIKTGESPEDAAQREFQEETGFLITDKTRFKQCASNVFRLDLTDQEAADVEASWKAMDDLNQGEVFNLKWTPITGLKKKSLNEESQPAHACLFKKPGGKRTRKSLRTKRRHTARRRL